MMQERQCCIMQKAHLLNYWSFTLDIKLVRRIADKELFQKIRNLISHEKLLPSF